MSTSIAVEGLTFSYDGQRILFENATFSLQEGDICTILGPNGVGKSTLLNCLGGYLKPSAGSVAVYDKPLKSLSDRDRAKTIGFTAQMQDSSINLKVEDYLVLGRFAHVSMLKMPKKADWDKVDEVTRAFNISHLMGSSMSRLSGGERQLVEIARSLVQDASIILMDEPTNHLDIKNQAQILSLIKDLAFRLKKTLVITTHSPDHAVLLGGYSALLFPSESLRFGGTEEIVSEENLSRVYGETVKVVYVEEFGRKICAIGGDCSVRAP